MNFVGCGDDCTLLIETDTTGEGRGVDALPVPENMEPSQGQVLRELTPEEEHDGPAVTISIMFYVTEKYMQQIGPVSPRAYVDIIIAKINEGYIKSELNMRVEAHCIRPATISEVTDPGELLEAFRDSKIFLYW